MQFGLEEKDIAKINAILAACGAIDTAILYGSRAKGNYRPASDIDITLTGEDLDTTLLNQLSTRLDDLPLPYTFDLSLFAHIANPELVAHIKRVGVIFYQRS